MTTSRGPVLSRRALNRATLARQLLLERSTMSTLDAIEHLGGLQAQTPQTPYTGLWSRLAAFDPDELGRGIVDRSIVRMGLMRVTIHMVTARDAWGFQAMTVPARERMGQTFIRRLTGVDIGELVAFGRGMLADEPRTLKDLGDHFVARWPDQDRQALGLGFVTSTALIQVPPRGVWGQSGAARWALMDEWLADRPPTTALDVDGFVRRYLAAFGPASVMDAQTWCGLTKLREVFERLRPTLLTFTDETGRELFDLPDAPRPPEDTDAPVRFLYDYDNILLSHADRSRMSSPDPVRPIEHRDNEPISTFLVDGVVAGAWRVARTRTSIVLRLSPILTLTPARIRELTGEGERLLAFLAPGIRDRDIQVDP
jgi:hypothetical protein